jgi:hypothetical protein
LVDPVDEFGVGLDELGSCLPYSFELALVAAEPRPLAFEKPSVRLDCTLPRTLSRLQPGGTGLEVIAAAVSGKESTVEILDAAEDLFVGPARNLEVLVARSNGCVRPPPDAGAEVGKVRFERDLLFVDVSEFVGDVRRDTPDELSVLGTKLGEALGG